MLSRNWKRKQKRKEEEREISGGKAFLILQVLVALIGFSFVLWPSFCCYCYFYFILFCYYYFFCATYMHMA
jgi:uncharacterized membrane protein